MKFTAIRWYFLYSKMISWLEKMLKIKVQNNSIPTCFEL